MTKQQSPSPIRMPEDLKEWIRTQSKLSMRSFNMEVVMMLNAERKRRDSNNAK